MTATTIPKPVASATEPVASAHREYYIDHLRSVLTMQVIVFHCAITYGSVGGWFYYELHPSASLASALLSLFVLTSQAYFMGFFFLLAGYFTPSSLDRKGYARFLADRFLRLGVPLAAFALVLGPVTVAMAHTRKAHDFWQTLVSVSRGGHFINGPLWFAQALLLFSLGYCAYRALMRKPLEGSLREISTVPSTLWWLISAVGVGIVAVLLRIDYPVGKEAFGLQVGFFSSYIFLFALGIAAYRHDWLRNLTWRNARWWILSLPVLWVLMPIHLTLDRSADTFSAVGFEHGIPWAAVFWALWEPFVAWGFIAGFLLLFRRYCNRRSSFWSWLDRRAYAAYIIHPPVLVGATLLFGGWVAPALVKWVCTGSSAVVTCWLIADPLVRTPGLRRIL